MSLADLLAEIVAGLDRAGIPHMVAGSMLAVQRDRIDTDYLHHWAAILEVAEDLQAAIEAAESET